MFVQANQKANTVPLIKQSTLEVEGLISTGEAMTVETKAEPHTPEPHVTAPEPSTFIAPLKRNPESTLSEVADRATGSGTMKMRDASTHIDSSHIESPGPTSATIVTPQCICGNGVLPLLSRRMCEVHSRTLSKTIARVIC